MKVIRKNGPALHGEVVKKGEFYEITSPAGTILVPADTVERVENYISFEQEYARRLAQLAADDNEARYRLANWCRSQGKLAEAADQLRKLLKVEPKSTKAAVLLDLVEKQLKNPENVSKITQSVPAGLKLATEADIQAVRRAELRGDDKVRIVFRNNVLKRFVDYMLESEKYTSDDARRFYDDLRPIQQAIEMIDSLPARKDIHSDILIDSNPRSITEFKSSVWPFISQSCASGQCHGGPEGAGKLKLINQSGDNEAVTYTNLLTLAAYHNIDGWLIDRNRPGRSLLLDYLSEETDERKRHPGGKVKLLEDIAPEQLKAIDTWINQLMIPADGYKVPDFGKNPSIEAPKAPQSPKSIDSALTPPAENKNN